MRKRFDFLPRPVALDIANRMIEGSYGDSPIKPLLKLADTLDDYHYDLLVEALAQVVQHGRFIAKTVAKERATQVSANQDEARRFREMDVAKMNEFVASITGMPK